MRVSNAVKCISKPSSVEIVAIDSIPPRFFRPISVPGRRLVAVGDSFLLEEHDEDFPIESGNKIVYFSDPVVTALWNIPSPDASLCGDLYYSSADIDR